MAKIKEVKASPNHQNYWKGRASHLNQMITLVKMSTPNNQNVNYSNE